MSNLLGAGSAKTNIPVLYVHAAYISVDLVVLHTGACISNPTAFYSDVWFLDEPQVAFFLRYVFLFSSTVRSEYHFVSIPCDAS